MLFFKELINRFYFKERYKFYFLILLSFIAGLFEYMGLILIFQFVLFLSNPNTVYCKKIIYFFNNYFNITDFQQISFIIGISVALIYILKNIYMLIFTKYNNSILEDLSVKITIKTLKNLLFQDFLIINKITNEEKLATIQKITIIVWQYCLKYVNLIINCCIAGILIIYLFYKFTIPAIVATVFISILSFIEYKYLKKCSIYQNKHFSNVFNELNLNLLTIISSIKEIKINNKEQHFIDKIKKSCISYACLNKDRNFNNVFHIYFTEISVMFTFILVLGALFYTTNFNNQLLITSISTICVIILRLTPTVNRAQSCLYAINSNRKIVEEFIDFDNHFEKNIKLETTNEILPFNKEIELKNVFFSYGDDEGLKNINLKITKNDFIGIVGKSGCYKTTLSLIISGLFKPAKGEILIDNQPLNEYKKWQNNISLLSQDFMLLDDLIKNIPDNILDKLDIKSLDTNKNNLSMGQKQRLALASILNNNKNIIILDEATSSVDVLNEDKVNKILHELKGKKTIILIAHRLQILKHCTKIIYMDKGQIIDIDGFNNLNEKYGEFKKIVELSKFTL